MNPGVFLFLLSAGNIRWMKAAGNLEPHAISLFLGAFCFRAFQWRAGSMAAMAASPIPTQVADSLPFAALIGLIALGAILVLRKMIRDLF